MTEENIVKNLCFFRPVIAFALFSLLFACSKVQRHPGNPTHSSNAPLSGVELLQSIENAFVGVAERSNPAVVGITALDVNRQGGRSRGADRQKEPVLSFAKMVIF